MPESEFHINYRQMAREWNLKKSGCVCRALASISQAPLTPEQENLRLDQVNQQQDALRKILHREFAGEIAEDKILLEHLALSANSITLISDLISAIQNQPDTPAGRKLSGFDIKVRTATPDDIRKLCKKNHLVMVLTDGHAMHITSGHGKKFTSLSDDNISVKLENRPHWAFVFTPRENP